MELDQDQQAARTTCTSLEVDFPSHLLNAARSDVASFDIVCEQLLRYTLLVPLRVDLFVYGMKRKESYLSIFCKRYWLWLCEWAFRSSRVSK